MRRKVIASASEGSPWRADAIAIALLCAAKAALGAYVLARGFSHVSDDDYARVVIAQGFAHAPKLDPSGTSWLPFPFWTTGAVMMAIGRSLEVARWLAFVLGVASVVPPYLAMRAIGCARGTTVAACALAASVPWNAWLGVATVPEAWTASLVAAGAIAIVAPRARVWAAAGLFAASLSRYEAWPVCAVVAMAGLGFAMRAHGRERRRDLYAAALAAAGPIAWMAWNAHAHGDAFHFFARVAAYRRAIGAANEPMTAKILAFPEAIASASPAIAIIAAIGAVALVSDRGTRARWALPVLGAAAMLAFLVYGDVQDGAPTHHPERAILGLVWILAAFGADATRALARQVAWGRTVREAIVAGAIAAGVIGLLATRPRAWLAFPGMAESESRDAQLERGRELRNARAVGIDVTPCAYEHFALLAAYEAPERARIEAPTKAPVDATCPRVELVGEPP